MNDLANLSYGVDEDTGARLNDLVWEVINDVCSSYELALIPLVGEVMTGHVNDTVFDYLSNHYDGAVPSDQSDH